MSARPNLHNYHVGPENTVIGALKVLGPVDSPQLGDQRDLLIWLPPSYARSDRHYPVLYMHDGQNLFDRATGFAGQEWQVDETMTALSGEGVEAIVVGLPHGGKQRMSEYNPFPEHRRGRGRKYLKFLVHTVKPLIDAEFRTLPDRAHTGIMGSSMGGLISLFGFFHWPNTFGFVGAMSPSLWVGGGALYRYLEGAPYVPGRVYIDNGTREGSAKPLDRMLQHKGYRPGENLLYVEEKGGEHTEAAWAGRLPNALRFLLRA